MKIQTMNLRAATYDDFKAWMLNKKAWYLFQQRTLENDHDDSFIARKFSNSIISGAFTWTSTQEGHNFWSDLDKAWLNAAKEIVDTTTTDTKWKLMDLGGHINILCNGWHVFKINEDGTFTRYTSPRDVTTDKDFKIKERV